MRTALLDLIFGSPLLPSTLPVTIPDVASPIPLDSDSVDRLETTTAGGLVNRAYLYRPRHPIPGRRLLLHQGHTPTPASHLGDYGLAAVAQSALVSGYEVVMVGLPGRTGNDGSADHSQYTSLRPFVEPAVSILNLLGPMPCVGISGGGWAITVLAAIDERVHLSVPVSGSLPRAYRITPATIGDWEQNEVYAVCDYPALYALGCSDGRLQTQVLTRDDPCCFGHDNYGDDYGALVVGPVQAVAATMGGTFEWVEDATHSEHQISPWCLSDVLSPLLDLRVPSGVVSHQQAQIVGTEGAPDVAGQNGVWVEWTASGYTGSHLATTPHPSHRVIYHLAVPPGPTEISVHWPARADRASDVPVSVRDQDGELLASWQWDQRGAAGMHSRSLGEVQTDDGEITVEIGAWASDGTVVVDTVEWASVVGGGE